MEWRDDLAYDKDPQSVEPHGLDWTPWLAELGSGATIAESSWKVNPTTLTLSEASIVTGGKRTQVKLSGGLRGTKYRIVNHITTDTGMEDERSMIINVKHR